MAHTLSARKRVRQNLKRRERNLLVKGNIKKEVRKFKKLLEAKQIADAQELLFKQIYKLIDKACSKGVYHKNTAARKKSRLVKLLNKSKHQTETATLKVS